MYPDDMTQAFIDTLRRPTRIGSVDWRIAEPADAVPVAPPPLRFEATHKGVRITLYRERATALPRGRVGGDDEESYVLAIQDVHGLEVWRAERVPHEVRSLYRLVRERLTNIDDTLTRLIDPETLASYVSAREARVQDLLDGDGLLGWLRRQRRAMRDRLFAPRHA